MKRLFIAIFTTIAFFAAAAPASARPPTIAIISTGELDPALAARVAAARGPVVLTFYDRKDTGSECVQQPAVEQDVARRFSGKVTLLQADVADQDQEMIERARIAVCPTHLFVLERHGDTLVTKRIWGYLSEADFQEVLHEFYGVQP